MRISSKIKVNGIKLLDWLNETFYYYAPQPLMFASDEALEATDRIFYEDIKNAVAPDGFYSYGYHIDKAIMQNRWYPLSGDQCLHQGLLITTVAFRCAVKQDKSDYELLERLINAACSLVTDEGKLLRGRTSHYQDGEKGKWKRAMYRVDSHNVSGDQLGGFVLWVAVIKYLINNEKIELNGRICQLIDDTVKRLYESMQMNMMMLTGLDGEVSTGEFPYWSVKACDGQATTVLALTLLAGDYDFANTLIKEYDYDRLCEYAEVHLFGRNNWFGAHVTAISLFSIYLSCLGCKPYKVVEWKNSAVKGLDRIAFNTRDWGHGLYSLLWCFASGQQPNSEQVRSWLVSYIHIEIPEPIKKGKTWYGKKWKTAIPIRARWDSDYMIQRELFVNPPSDATSPEGMYPDHAWTKYYRRHDFCLTKALKDYLERR